MHCEENLMMTNQLQFCLLSPSLVTLVRGRSHNFVAPRPLFTKPTNLLQQDHVKPRNREIQV